MLSKEFQCEYLGIRKFLDHQQFCIGLIIVIFIPTLGCFSKIDFRIFISQRRGIFSNEEKGLNL